MAVLILYVSSHPTSGSHKVYPHSFLTSALDGGEESPSCTGHSIPADTLLPINHFLAHRRLTLNVLNMTEHKFYVHHALRPALEGTALDAAHHLICHYFTLRPHCTKRKINIKTINIFSSCSVFTLQVT